MKIQIGDIESNQKNMWILMDEMLKTLSKVNCSQATTMSFLKKAKDKIVEESKEAGGKAKASVKEGGVLHEGAEKVGGGVKKAGSKVVEETKKAGAKVKDKID